MQIFPQIFFDWSMPMLVVSLRGVIFLPLLLVFSFISSLNGVYKIMSDDAKNLDPIFTLSVGDVIDTIVIADEKQAYNATMKVINSGSTHGDREKFAPDCLAYFADYTLKECDQVELVIGDKSKTITTNLGAVIRIAKVYAEMELSVAWSGTRGGNKGSVKEMAKSSKAKFSFS